MSYMKLLILAPVYFEVNTELVESFDKQLALDCSKSASACEFHIEPPLTSEGCEPVTEVPRISKLDIFASLPPDLDINYLDFPFLTNRKTLVYLNNPDTHIMFIMRGLSGSGKSSIVNIIRSSFKHVVVCSADDYFCQQDGSYKFEPEFLTSAHETCQRKAKQACTVKVPVVVIDNTNVRKWEFKFYVDLAKMNGYVVVLVQPKTPWRWDARELAARNKHGVPAELLQQKIAKFDNVIPAYYGWFLNEKRSKCLISLCSQIFLECISKFPRMKQDFLKELKVKFDRADDETIQEILGGYYASEGSRSPLLHCTAKFCSWGKVPGGKDYHERQDVQQVCGQMFILTITGLVITKKTLGARVTLGPSESVFFARPEEKEWGSPNVTSSHGRKKLADSVMEGTNVTSSHGRKTLAESVMEYAYENNKVGRKGIKKGKDQLTVGKKNKKKQKNDSDYIEKVSKKSARKKKGRFYDKEQLGSECEDTNDCQDFTETRCASPGFENNNSALVHLSDMFPLLKNSNETRSAHFTIRTARGVESRDVNFDVLHACDVEASVLNTMSNFVPVSRGQARYYGDGLCCVYFDRPLNVRTLFSGYY